MTSWKGSSVRNRAECLSGQGRKTLEKAILRKAVPVCLGGRIKREGSDLPEVCCLHLVTKHSQSLPMHHQSPCPVQTCSLWSGSEMGCRSRALMDYLLTVGGQMILSRSGCPPGAPWAAVVRELGWWLTMASYSARGSTGVPWCGLLPTSSLLTGSSAQDRTLGPGEAKGDRQARIGRSMGGVEPSYPGGLPLPPILKVGSLGSCILRCPIFAEGRGIYWGLGPQPGGS